MYRVWRSTKVAIAERQFDPRIKVSFPVSGNGSVGDLGGSLTYSPGDTRNADTDVGQSSQADRLAGHQRDRTVDARRPAQSSIGCQEIAVEKFR